MRVSHTFTRPFQSPETRCAPSASNASDPMIPACGMVGTISALKSDCALALDRHGSTSIDISAKRRALARICPTRPTPLCRCLYKEWPNITASALRINGQNASAPPVYARTLFSATVEGSTETWRFEVGRSNRLRASALRSHTRGLDKWLARNVRDLPVQHNNVIA